jgi:hypothetical protein
MEQPKTIIASFNWTLDELKERQKELAKIKEPKRLINTIVSLGILIILILLFVISMNTNSKILYFQKFQDNILQIAIYAIPFIVFFIVFIVIKMQAPKRDFMQSLDRNKRILVTINQEEITYKVSDIYEVKWKWKSFIEVGRTMNGFWFFHSPGAGFWIPVHAFSSSIDIEELSKLACRLTPKYTLFKQ